MARLPQPGSDGGIWGDVLNDFLNVSHANDGTLKSGSVSNDSIADNSLTSSKLVNNTITGAKLVNGTITDTQIASANIDGAAAVPSLRTLGTGANQAMPGNASIIPGAHASTHKGDGTDPIAVATVSVSGLMSSSDKTKLDGIQSQLDLKQPIDGDLTDISALSASNDDILQRKSGEWTNRTPAQLKLDLSLTKTDVGLGNVDNTSDANKPVSVATQTALNLKADDNAVVKLVGDQTIAGTKTFSSDIITTAIQEVGLNTDKRISLNGNNFVYSTFMSHTFTLWNGSAYVPALTMTNGSHTFVGNVEATSYTAGGATVPTISGSANLTNKRITPRVLTIASSATPSINTDDYDAVSVTALATAITSMSTNLSGTPTNFQKLMIRIKDDGTARAISWGASFEAKGVALPTTTVTSKVLTVGFIYDSVTSKWGCVASVQEA